MSLKSRLYDAHCDQISSLGVTKETVQCNEIKDLRNVCGGAEEMRSENEVFWDDYGTLGYVFILFHDPGCNGIVVQGRSLFLIQWKINQSAPGHFFFFPKSLTLQPNGCWMWQYEVSKPYRSSSMSHTKTTQFIHNVQLFLLVQLSQFSSSHHLQSPFSLS